MPMNARLHTLALAVYVLVAGLTRPRSQAADQLAAELEAANNRTATG